MIGKIFITRSGYDPDKGKHVKDPYLGSTPSLGACRTDIRKAVNKGDHIFVVSGKVPGYQQYLMGGFEVVRKVTAAEAYWLFPERRLVQRPDGEIDGNIIVDASGVVHSLDTHRRDTISARTRDYVIGCHPVVLATPEEVARGRAETLNVLCRILGRVAPSPFALLGRWGKTLTERQTHQLTEWMYSVTAIKKSA